MFNDTPKCRSGLKNRKALCSTALQSVGVSLPAGTEYIGQIGRMEKNKHHAGLVSKMSKMVVKLKTTMLNDSLKCRSGCQKCKECDW